MQEIMSAWPAELQVVAYLGTAVIVGIVGIVAGVTLIVNLRVLLRGYPPPRPASPAVDPVQECHHEDNLTGLCLRQGNCRTSDECHRMIADIDTSSATRAG